MNESYHHTEKFLLRPSWIIFSFFPPHKRQKTLGPNPIDDKVYEKSANCSEILDANLFSFITAKDLTSRKKTPHKREVFHLFKVFLLNLKQKTRYLILFRSPLLACHFSDSGDSKYSFSTSRSNFTYQVH